MKVLGRLLIFSFCLVSAFNRVDAAEPTWDSLILQSKRGFETEEYQKALTFGEKALQVAEKSYGPDHLKTAASMFNLAEVYQALGSYNNSESHYLGALRIRENVLDQEHPHVADCYYGLASLLMLRGEYGLAEGYGKLALSVYQKTNGQESLEVGKALMTLAGIKNGQTKFNDAENDSKQALEIIEKTTGPNSLLTGKALLMMVTIRLNRENYSDAESLLQQADLIYMKNYRKKTVDTGAYLYLQGELLRLKGDSRKAQGFYKKARSYFERLGKNNPELGKTLIGWARCLRTRQKYLKAEKMHEEGLTMLEGSLGPNSINLERPMAEMVDLLTFLEKYEESGMVALRLMKLHQNLYGQQNPTVAFALNRLAWLCLKQNKITEAEFYGKQALSINETAKDPNYTGKAESLNLLARIRITQGDYPEAQSYLEQSSNALKQSSDKESTLSIALTETEALLKMARGNYVEAEPVLNQAISQAEKSLGMFHTELARLLKELAELYRKQGRIKDAAAVEKRVKKIYSKVF